MEKRKAKKGEATAFFERALAHDSDECLLWPFSCNPINGYPHLNGGFAHIAMCRRIKGERPTPKHEAAHSCHKRNCIAPRHLSWKTHSENMLDKRENGTANKAWWGHKGKLNADQVAEIRALKGQMTQAAIATRFNITEATVRNVQTGKTYSGKVTDWKAVTKRSAETRRLNAMRI